MTGLFSTCSFYSTLLLYDTTGRCKHSLHAWILYWLAIIHSFRWLRLLSQTLNNIHQDSRPESKWFAAWPAHLFGQWRDCQPCRTSCFNELVSSVLTLTAYASVLQTTSSRQTSYSVICFIISFAIIRSFVRVNGGSNNSLVSVPTSLKAGGKLPPRHCLNCLMTRSTIGTRN